MDWTKIIETAIVSGGFLTLFLITEKKTAAALENMTAMFNILQGLYNEALARNKEKDKKIDELFNEVSNLHTKIDDVNTMAAKAEMKRCDRINCGKRIPPMYDKWHVDDGPEVVGVIGEAEQ